jgi:hypothetical protein
VAGFLIPSVEYRILYRISLSGNFANMIEGVAQNFGKGGKIAKNNGGREEEEAA